MKVVAFVAEYNPFHYGHKYHLKKSKEITRANYSIALISGSFVQRGEPSLIDKWTKTKMAIDNGVDLVLELPIVFSVQSAELFAYGAIKLLNALNIVDYISFGSEIGDLNILNQVAQILAEEPYFFNNRLKYYLNTGQSYSVSRSKALEEYIEYKNIPLNESIEKILKSPNNILSIEYLKAIYRTKSNIEPITFKRIGSSFKEKKLNSSIASATAIRHNIVKNNLNSIKNTVPKETYIHLSNFLNNYKYFNVLENYSQIILYLLNTTPTKKLKQIIDIENGLENRIIKYSLSCVSLDTIIDNVTTKRYPKTRIQRIFIHLLLGLYKNNFETMTNDYPKYFRILGANEKGLYLLRKIKQKSNLFMINKFSDYKKVNNSTIRAMIEFDKKGTDIFFLGLKDIEDNWANKDFFISPYIKK